MVEEGVLLMCEYCERVTGPGTIGRMYYDGYGNYCEIVWFDGRPMPMLQIRSDGVLARSYVPCCPVCGRNIQFQTAGLTGVRPSREAGA